MGDRGLAGIPARIAGLEPGFFGFLGTKVLYILFLFFSSPMKIPSTQECMLLLDKYKTFDNIIAHTKAVNKVAVFLAEKMKGNGIDVDVDLVNAASLLHDIAKSTEIRARDGGDRIKHAFRGCEILTLEGYPQIGQIIKKHELDSVLNSLLEPKTWEEKIVYYADKRVNHDRIVSLNERIRYFNDKYVGQVEDRMDEILPRLLAIEKEILTAASVDESLDGLD